MRTIGNIVGILATAFMLTVLPALILAAAPAADGTTKATTLEQLRQQRKKAAHRKRRIIFNNDGNEPVYHAKKATPRALLECRTTALLGTQVDSIFYCTWCSGFGCFTHNTKVGEIFTCKAKTPDGKPGFSTNKTEEFIKQGTDPLKIMVEFCHKNKIEIFWSMRTNDTHDAWGGWYSPYLFPKLKKEHPEYLVASKEHRGKHGGWSAVDFGRSEIRDLAFKYVEEVCKNYDVDGIELDFFRHLVHFKRHAMGKDVGQEECDMMTGLLARIHKMTEEVGLARGRPILVAVRVPDSVLCAKAVGFDVVRWLEKDLIDILVVSGYFRLNPWPTSVELGHKYGVPVYPCLSESRMRATGESAKARRSLEAYRARATNVWNSGADGVYMFNFFDPHSPLWSQLGDPKTLEPLDKVYTTGARGTRPASRWVPGGEKRFLTRSVVSLERPMKLTPGKAATAELPVGEQPGAARDVKLHLCVKGLSSTDELAVTLNGKLLGGAVRSKEWFVYPVKPELVRKGTNRIEMTLAPGSKAKPTLIDLLLWVRKGV